MESPTEDEVIAMQVKAIKAKTVTMNPVGSRVWPLTAKDAKYLRECEFTPRAVGSTILALEGDNLVEQINYTGPRAETSSRPRTIAHADPDQTTEAQTPVPKKRKWDDMSIKKRVKLVRRAGLPGKYGSAAWADLTKADRRAIKAGHPITHDTAETEDERAERFAAQPDKKHLAGRRESGDNKLEDWDRVIQGSGGKSRDETPPKRKKKRAAKAPDVQEEAVEEETPTEERPRKKKRDKVAVQDYLMWVGAVHYPTVADFRHEARYYGCSKRVGHMLDNIVPGKTRIFLAHDEGFVEQGFIFGYFTVKGIDIVVPDGKELPEGMIDASVPVSETHARAEAERGCGWRVLGGIYLVSETDPDTLKALAKDLGVKRSTVRGGLVLIDPPKDFSGHRHFRGAKKVDGAAILAKTKTRTAMSYEHPMPKKQPEWTPEDDRALMKAVKNRDEDTPRAQVFAAFAFKTGHAKTRVAYRYEKLRQQP